LVNILVADDDPSIRHLYKLILDREGHEVYLANDGVEALEQAKKHDIDVLITDIIMPKKEGIETIVEIREMNPEIKIIAISGGGRRGNQDFLRMAEMVGANYTLAKPFEPHDLLKILKTCLKD
jgi:CheY-like chemotaxis protein